MEVCFCNPNLQKRQQKSTVELQTNHTAASIHKTVLFLIRSKLLLENNYIESKLLEGFWSDISGVIEHTELLTYITNHAREKQR